MALSPYPLGSSRCGASKTVMVIPWIDGVRRPSLKAWRTSYCDKPNYHVIKKEPSDRRHFDRSTGLSWFDDEEECDE